MSQKLRIEKFLKKKQHELSAFSFVSIFLWKDFFDFELKEIDGALCVFAKNNVGCFMYLPPLGKNLSNATVAECFKIMSGHNKGSGVSRIENVTQEDLPLFPAAEYTHFEKSGEYVYTKDDIASLKGNPFKSKRALYNYFVQNYSSSFVPFENSMHQECAALYREWADERRTQNRDDVYRQMLEENEKVHSLALKNFDMLGLMGRVVLVEGKIRAYSFGFPLNDEMFCVLFEVADLSFKGLPVFIFKEFCADPALKQFKFINVMDDFGLENIRATKLSFRPIKVIPSYVISRKGK